MTLKYKLFGKPGNLDEFIKEIRKKGETDVALALNSGWVIELGSDVRVIDVIASSGEQVYRVAREFPSDIPNILARQLDFEWMVKPKLDSAILKAGNVLESRGISVTVEGKPFSEYKAEKEGNRGTERN